MVDVKSSLVGYNYSISQRNIIQNALSITKHLSTQSTHQFIKPPRILNSYDFNMEKSPTSKGKCIFCRKQIFKGELRCYFNEWKEHNLPEGYKKFERMFIKRLICYKCAPRCFFSAYSWIEHNKRHLAKINAKWRRSMKGKRVNDVIINSETIEELKKGVENEKTN